MGLIITPKIKSFQYFLLADISTTSTTPVDATGLSFPVAANRTYWFWMGLKTNVNSLTAGMKFQFTGPASPTYLFIRMAGASSAVNTVGGDVLTAFSTLTTTAYNAFAGSGGIVVYTGQLTNGANAGTVQLQYEKITSQTALIYKGSWIMATEVG